MIVDLILFVFMGIAGAFIWSLLQKKEQIKDAWRQAKEEIDAPQENVITSDFCIQIISQARRVGWAILAQYFDIEEKNGAIKEHGQYYSWYFLTTFLTGYVGFTTSAQGIIVSRDEKIGAWLDSEYIAAPKIFCAGSVHPEFLSKPLERLSTSINLYFEEMASSLLDREMPEYAKCARAFENVLSNLVLNYLKAAMNPSLETSFLQTLQLAIMTACAEINKIIIKK